MNKLLP